jgi:ribonuclease BN (tRNA processing enzyme)
MSNDSVRFIGTSDARPSSGRSHASLLLRLAGQTILLDCGEPAARNLNEAGINCGAIDAIVLSHLHSDHVGGFLQVMMSMWLDAKRKSDIPVYMPAEGIDVFKKLLHATYFFRELIKFEPDFRPLQTGKTFSIGAVELTPYPTTHLDSIRRLAGERHGIACEAFLFRIAGGGKQIVYSGDMGAASDMEPVLDRPLDLLISECAHFSPESLFKTLRGKPIQRLAMTHMTRLLWEKQGKLPALAQPYCLSDKLVVAHDGLELSF